MRLNVPGGKKEREKKRNSEDFSMSSGDIRQDKNRPQIQVKARVPKHKWYTVTSNQEGEARSTPGAYSMLVYN